MKKSLFILLAAGSILTACQKSSSGSNNNPNGTTDRIKTINTVTQTPAGSDSVLTTFYYNAQNNYTMEVTGTDTTFYTYTSNTMTTSENGYVTTYYLNASGRADSAREVVTSGNNTATAVFKYTYGSNGEMSEYNAYLVTAGGEMLEDTRTFTFTNGNLTLVDDITLNAHIPYTYTTLTTKTAYTEPEAVTGSDLGTGAVGNPIFGVPNTNLVATYEVEVNNSVYTITNSYTLDSQSRITTITATPAQGAPISPTVAKYTYY